MGHLNHEPGANPIPAGFGIGQLFAVIFWLRIWK